MSFSFPASRSELVPGASSFSSRRRARRSSAKSFAPVKCRADWVEARDITLHRTQDAMQLFECFSDLGILGRFSQESLGCPGHAKAAIVQIPAGKIEREALIGAVRPIIQYPLGQAPDDGRSVPASPFTPKRKKRSIH
jgi:hypothetical protein